MEGQYLEGEKKGHAEGLAEGELNKAKNVAKNLKAMGMELEDISKATGLSVAEIEKL
jgi:predicted transposase/invertase (TIGR01784 family)